MGKGRSSKASQGTEPSTSAVFSFSDQKAAFDPAVASLFSQSSGPIRVPEKPKKQVSRPLHKTLDDEQDLSSASDLDEDEDASEDEGIDSEAPSVPPGRIKSSSLNSIDPEVSTPSTKRKRKQPEADLESLYLQRLAREEEKENAERDADSSSKRRKLGNAAEDETALREDDNAPSLSDASGEIEVNEEGTLDIDSSAILKHETLLLNQSLADAEIDKAARTVFLANVSTSAIASKSARKTLIAHLSSPLSTIPAPKPDSSKLELTISHKLLTIRFRSTAYAPTLPKKAAYATAQASLNSSTTPSTNAYAVYSTPLAARTACKVLNATVVLTRHLRADLVAHPSPVDHRRCVFVGNLGFVDDETSIKAAEAAAGHKGAASSSKPLKGDVEEGLWRAFGTAGKVESVRVVRDPKTRVGKGFGYVQFVDQNGVEAALGMDGKKFPPMLMRKLRVVRAKKPSATAMARERAATGTSVSGKAAAKDGEERAVRRPEGRTRKLLGKAGAASANGANRTAVGKRGNGIRVPKDFIFEGHRASSKQGGGAVKGKTRSGPKTAKAKGKVSKGKPTTRSAKRGGEWKKKVGAGQISGRKAGRD